MDALIIVDLQYDFMPGGALGVKDADKVISVINKVMEKFSLVIVSQDWHPENHVSFAKTHGLKPGDMITVNGIKQELWPRHCVQNTHGAELVKELNQERVGKYVSKGSDPLTDDYSVFSDEALDRFLKSKGVGRIFFAGLTTDYCVKYSVLDAAALGYEAIVIVDACRAVHDEKKALEEIKKAGAKLVTSNEFLNHPS